MRIPALVLLCLIPAWPQQTTQSQTSVYTFDANGRRVLDSQRVAGAGGSEQRQQNMNGRVAPTERVEERVLSDDSNGKVVERIVRPYDANGSPLPPSKSVIATRKNSDGTQTVDTQTYRGNLNGGFAISERSRSVERDEGGRRVTETEIARPTLNGSLETVEKRTSTLTKTGNAKSTEDTLTYRKDTGGSFYTAAREVKETERRGATTVENVASYIAEDRRPLTFVGQVVSESTKRADGSESTEVNIYGTGAPGRPATNHPVLREQKLLEKNRNAEGTVEVLSIRRPTVDGSGTLSPAARISETVCKGSCQ